MADMEASIGLSSDHPDMTLSHELMLQVPIITTIAGARATAQALKGIKAGPLHQVPLQDYFPEAAELSNVEFKLND